MIYSLLRKIKNAVRSATNPKPKLEEPEKHMNIETPKSKLETILKEKDFDTLYPRAKPGTYRALCDNLEKNHIDTPKRFAAFIAQCAHESGGFSVTSENLNYSEQALNTVFGKYFVRAGRNAALYARNPEKIANIVYAGRMGNTSPGDGWKYRGRGFIQLTGRDNYAKFQETNTHGDVLVNPDLVAEDMNLSVLTAIWYWNTNNLNRFADSSDHRGLTKAINGGFNGLDDRLAQTNKLYSVFGLLPV